MVIRAGMPALPVIVSVQVFPFRDRHRKQLLGFEIGLGFRSVSAVGHSAAFALIRLGYGVRGGVLPFTTASCTNCTLPLPITHSMKRGRAQL